MSIMSYDDFVRLFQRTFGLKEDGWAGRDTEAKLHELAVLADVVVPVAPVNAIPRQLLADAVAHRERRPALRQGDVVQCLGAVSVHQVDLDRRGRRVGPT